MDGDFNRIDEIFLVSYSLKIFKLVLVVLNLTYLLAMFWIILCKAIEDFVYGVDFTDPDVAKEYPFEFLTYYNFNDRTPGKAAIAATYFAFTSLSTVGFGDFCPRSDLERAIGALILLLGVAIFSYVMGNFIGILN